jgi:hypothetical protein
MAAVRHLASSAKGYAALLQHLDVLFAVMLQDSGSNKDDVDVCDATRAAAALLRDLARTKQGQQQLCSNVQYADLLLGAVEHEDEKIALSAAQALDQLASVPTGCLLLCEQGRFDKLVRLLHECRFAQDLAECLLGFLKVVVNTVWPEEAAEQRWQQAERVAPHADAAAAADGDTTAESAAAGAAGGLVLQRGQVQLLVEVAKPAELLKPAVWLLKDICVISADHAALLGPYRGELKKMVDMLGRLGEVEWGLADPYGGHAFEHVQPFIVARQAVKNLVSCICRCVDLARMKLSVRLRMVQQELREALVCFAEARARYNACMGVVEAGAVAGQGGGSAQGSAWAACEVQKQQLASALGALVASSRVYNTVQEQLMDCS